VRFLTPTENKRLNELIGFLFMTLAVLLALSLISYSPHDVAFNVSAPPADGPLAHNWIGPVGAYGADLLFQVFGFAAFLLPAAALILGWKWFRSQALNSQLATIFGYMLLLLSLPSLLSLWHFPEVRGLPPGGMLGSLLSGSLQAGFNFWGASLIAFAFFLSALFMTTSFSFAGTHAWAKSPKGPIGAVEKLGLLQKAQARWQGWRDQREQERMRRRLEETRISGRKPVNQFGAAAAPAESRGSIQLGDENDTFETEKEEEKPRDSRKVPILFLNSGTKEKAASRKAGEPKIAKGGANYKLPSISLLREGERSHKLDEDELKIRARAIEDKCLEFDIQGRVTQINPGPVVTTFEFKPEAGIKYSRIISLTEDLCLALQAESILIERIPGKSTIGIEVPNINRQTIALREIIESPEFLNSPSKLTLAMGRDLHGRMRVTDLAAMPHLLIAARPAPAKACSSTR
jgi:S-DNA-T family DNA segregation ATPase FtsK/SpoIIIE